MSIIDLRHISKIFQLDAGLTYQALNDINLTIEKSEYVAITGASGSGKSTLMNIIGLLDQPTSGSYFLDGQDVSQLSESELAKIRNKKIGFVFQSFNLLPRTPSIENVALPLIYAGLSLKARLAQARIGLEQVSLSDKLRSFSNQLSGGQQQRVAIARALVTNPEVILADEPTGNLDSKSGADIISLFEKLHDLGKTIILITHDPAIAGHAPRVITVVDGAIVT